MSSVPEAINALREALLKKCVEGHVHDAFNHLASCLALLNSSSPSVQMIRKICTVLRKPVLLLYNTCLQPALRLSSSVLSTALGKLCDAHDVEDERLRAAWDATAEVILSGVLDFLDQKNNGNLEPDGGVWELLCRIICDFFFSDSSRGLPVLSVPLCLSAYNTLTETAARQMAVQNALRHSAILGGERLGSAISRTRDYLLLEALLMLFARLLPPTHNTSQGKLRRVKFLKEVLGSQKLFKCSAELLNIMQTTSGTHWDDVAAQIVDALASSDVTYPQPFSIDEIDVCGCVFPQPLTTDRLILDKHAFLANIVAENDDLCESLQVPYSHVRTITLDNSEQNVPKGSVLIMIYLTLPPLVANVEMKPPGGSHLYAKFLLQNDTVGRFMEALRRRGVGKLSFLNPLTRVQRKRKSISIGSGFKFVDDSSPMPSIASFENKVHHVNQVYKPDTEDSSTSEAIPAPGVGGLGSSPTPDLKPAFKDKSLVLEDFESAVAKDVSATLNIARLVPPANETSRPIHNINSPFSLRNSARAIRSSGDDDELSEISEFEHVKDTIIERVGAPTPCNRELKPTQHTVDCMRMNGSLSVTSALGFKECSNPVSKTGHSPEGVVQISPETGKPLLTSDSPRFGSSSSTQINVSPRLPSDVNTLLPTTGREVDDGVSVVSLDLIGTDSLKKLGVDQYVSSNMEHIVAPAGKPQTGIGLVEGELGQHSRCYAPSSGANQEEHSCTEITMDTSVPPKIAGSRRKREIIDSTGKATIEVDGDPTPLRKKSRDSRLRMKDDKIKANKTSLATTTISRVKRYRKTDKGFSSGIQPMAVDFDELPEPNSTCQGTRRSSRIKKRQTAATDGIRANVMRRKTQKAKPTEGQSTCGMGHNKLAAAPLQDTGTKETPFPKPNSHVSFLVPKSAENVTPETRLPPEMLKVSNILPCGTSQPAKEPRGDLDFVLQVSSHAMQVAEEQPRVKPEETVDDQHHVPGLCTVDNNTIRVQQVAGHPVSLVESDDAPEESRLIVESTPRTETVTIDLTIDNSPAQEKSELHKTSVHPMRSEVDIQTNFETFEQPDRITMKEPAVISPPRHRRRSVTFASPVGHVLDETVRSKAQVSSSRSVARSFLAGTRSQNVDPRRSRRSPSPFESNILSPLRMPTGSVSVRQGSPDSVAPHAALQSSKLSQAHVKASVHNHTADEVEIQDIVEVLNEIQAVIVKGISEKFRNIRKGIQHGRDEFTRHVLDELQGMVVENAKYFNGLVRLEEDYYKNGQDLTRCWEELIDCNDSIAVQFQNVLKEHDQNTSAKTFPKSLLPPQPVFPCRRANAW